MSSVTYRLENIDKFTLQTHLNKLARSRSRDRVLQIRSYVKAIFAEAVDQDFLAKDPARSLKTPSNLRESDKTTLTWDQLRSALAKLGLRDRILLKLDMTNALRPSELFGLKWKCFDANAPGISIQETTYKGKIRSFGKTRGSLTTGSNRRGIGSGIGESGGTKARIHLRKPLSFQAALGASWIRATSVTVCCTDWPRNWNCRS